MSDTTHNGWANYATWRINLEMFDGYEQEDTDIEAYDLGEQLKDQAEEAITGYGEIAADSLAVSYAMAFMSDVDWMEIATGLLDAAKE
jgi:hypothetical protein